MIVDHVTKFCVVDNVIGTMLENMLGEGGSSRQVSQNSFQQPTREHGQELDKKQGYTIVIQCCPILVVQYCRCGHNSISYNYNEDGNFMYL